MEKISCIIWMKNEKLLNLIWRYLNIEENYKIFLISISIYLFYCVLFFNLTIDDSFISLRYARNLKNGYSLTWNQNSERVEGYSNYLWVMIESFLFYFCEDPLIIVKVIGIIFSLITLLLILRISHQMIKADRFKNIPALMISILPAWGYYAVSGLETKDLYFLKMKISSIIIQWSIMRFGEKAIITFYMDWIKYPVMLFLAFYL